MSRSGKVPEFQREGQNEGQLLARSLDIRDPAAIDRSLADVVEEFGRLDAVVNAAGIAVAGPLEDTPLNLVRAQLETNLMGATYLVRAALPYLRRFAPSRFVHISSIAAHVALPYQSLYSASHFAMSGLCQSLSYEMEPHGVRVTLVEPGSVRTELTQNRSTAEAGKSYRAIAGIALDVNDADEKAGVDPDAVARVVEGVLMSQSGPSRRSVGHWHERVTLPVQRLLPASMFRRIIKAHYKI